MEKELNIEDVKKILAEKRPKIDEMIKRVIPEKPEEGTENLYDAAWYAIGAGGKRLRPFLCLDICRRLGGDEDRALPFATACEVLHNWLLVHDDIEDGDEMRRGKPSVWKRYGIPHAINVGDAMAHKSFELVLMCKDRGCDNETVFELVNLFVKTALHTTEGQTMEMNFRTRDNVSEEEYMKMIQKKTGYYLACPMIGGAIIAGADDDVINKITEYGHYIGPAYQIRDDIIDLTQGKGRGEIGSDIKEGKRSILVVHTASKCTPAEKEKLFNILNKPREQTTKEDVQWVVNLFEKYKTIGYAQKRAEYLFEKAKQVISELPEDVRQGMEIVGKFIVKRDI